MSIFGDIAKVAGGAVKNVGPAGNIGQVLGPLLNAAMMQQLSLADSLKTLLQKDYNQITQLLQGLGSAGGPGGAGPQGGAVAVDRIAYVAVLQKALEKASHQQAFNLETAINDLWTSVSNLRGGGAALQHAASGVPSHAGGGLGAASGIPGRSAAAMQSQMQQMNQTMDAISKILLQNMSAKFSIIENLR